MSLVVLEPEDLALATPEEVNSYYAYVVQEARDSGDWREWLLAFARDYTREEPAPHHAEFWEWVYEVGNARPKPFVGIWPRGGAKSTSAELAVLNLGARGVRKYCLYVCETQEQADDHVQNIASLIESSAMEVGYPTMAERLVGKYGNVKGWRRNRLRTNNGFTVDALGLDTASRGVKLDEQRPDLMVLDDLDGELDAPKTTDKKIKTLSHALLPAGAKNLAVIAIQNMVHADSIFARLADGRAEYLADRIVSGPIPAIEGLATDNQKGRTLIVGGKPTWEGQSIERCQDILDDIGITAFLSECQHDTEPPPGGMFSHLTYEHCAPEDVPDLVRTVVWVDPAVSTTDNSDAMGIQCDGIDADGVIYRLRSYEQKTTPLACIEKAVTWAVELGASEVGVETDQGGDTWITVYKEACKNAGIPDHQRPKFKSEKGGTIGPKAHRAGLMLADYERGGRIVHVTGSHQLLERALRRFPVMKPYDLVDAAFWSWRSLRPAKRKRMIRG